MFTPPRRSSSSPGQIFPLRFRHRRRNGDGQARSRGASRGGGAPEPRPVPPPRRARAAPRLQDRRTLPPVGGGAPPAPVRPFFPRAVRGGGGAAAGRRAALPGGPREGSVRRGAVPAQEEDGRGQVRGVLAAAGGVLGTVVGSCRRALTVTAWHRNEPGTCV